MHLLPSSIYHAYRQQNVNRSLLLKMSYTDVEPYVG